MQLRVKFHTSNLSEEATYDTFWSIGPPESQGSQYLQQTLPADSFQEFDIPSGLASPDGTLTIAFLNRNDLPMLFPMDDGIEVLYRESAFGVNFCRGLLVILCWLAFLAAIGLAAASFLSFPVAAFTSIGVLAMAMFSGTLKSVVENGTVTGWDAGSSSYGHATVDVVMVPHFHRRVGSHQSRHDLLARGLPEFRPEHHLGRPWPGHRPNRPFARRRLRPSRHHLLHPPRTRRHPEPKLSGPVRRGLMSCRFRSPIRP